MLTTMDANQETIDAKIDVNQEKMEAAMHSVWSELEEAIRHWVEDILSCVHKELTEKIDETQLDLQAVKGDVTDTNKDSHKVIENTRNGLHLERDFMSRSRHRK
jgi:hypothetical protein